MARAIVPTLEVTQWPASTPLCEVVSDLALLEPDWSVYPTPNISGFTKHFAHCQMPLSSFGTSSRRLCGTAMCQNPPSWIQCATPGATRRPCGTELRAKRTPLRLQCNRCWHGRVDSEKRP